MYDTILESTVAPSRCVLKLREYLTVREIARACNVSERAVYYWQTGRADDQPRINRGLLRLRALYSTVANHGTD